MSHYDRSSVVFWGDRGLTSGSVSAVMSLNEARGLLVQCIMVCPWLHLEEKLPSQTRSVRCSGLLGLQKKQNSPTAAQRLPEEERDETACWLQTIMQCLRLPAGFWVSYPPAKKMKWNWIDLPLPTSIRHDWGGSAAQLCSIVTENP